MSHTMPPRERILAAFRHRTPDRTPTDGWFHDQVVARLKEHFHTDDWSVVLGALGIEGWAHCGVWLRVEEFDRAALRRSYKGMARTGVWLDERTYRDAWGTVSRIGESGWYEEWVGGPLVDADGADIGAVRNLMMPGVRNIAFPGGSVEKYAAGIAELKKKGKFVIGAIPNPYKTAWQLRGMDNVLADYLINRDFLEALYDRLYEVYGEMARLMARHGCDMITVTGDIAMQDRIIMGPDTWRAVDKPRMARLIADCRRENPDVFMYIHSDGNVMDLMDDIVEIGFDVVNPIQPECMDPVEVKRKWGDRIVIHGGISLQRALLHGTPSDVREEVESLVRQCGYDGGLVVFPSNVIQPDSPIENVVACFHAARDFDVRTLRRV